MKKLKYSSKFFFLTIFVILEMKAQLVITI